MISTSFVTFAFDLPLIAWPWPYPCHREGHIYARRYQDFHADCVICGVREAA